MDSPVAVNHISYLELLVSSAPETLFRVNGKLVLSAAFVQQHWNANTDAFASSQILIREQQQQLKSLQQQIENLRHLYSECQDARAASNRSLTIFREMYHEIRKVCRERTTLLDTVTAERDSLRARAQSAQQQPEQPPQLPQQPPLSHEAILGQNQRLENLLTSILNRTPPSATPPPTHSTLDFETRARLKAHRIPVYKAEPDLEVIIRFLKSVEHHVRLGGGSGDGVDAKRLSIAWTHLDSVLAYPWFATWIGKAPWFISETNITASRFDGCTWEAFTTAFRAQFGSQHAVQKVRQQLRDLEYNKDDVAAFHRRFLELAIMLDLPSSSPYPSGLWLDYHAKLPPSLQQNLDSVVMVSNRAGQATTLEKAIELVAQFAARSSTHPPGPEQAPFPNFQAPYQAPTPTPARHSDAAGMDLSHTQVDLNAMACERRGLRCYGCGGLGHIRAECASTGGGTCGAPGRDRPIRTDVAQSWPSSRGGGQLPGRGRGGTARGRGGRHLQRGLYVTVIGGSEEEAEETSRRKDEEEEALIAELFQ